MSRLRLGEDLSLTQGIGLKIDGSKLKKGFGYFIIIIASCVIIKEIY